MKPFLFTFPLSIKYQLGCTTLVLLLFWLSDTPVVLAQTIKWDKTYGGTENDDITTVISTPDGGYLLGGTSSSDKGGDKSENSRGGSDFWILKTDRDGRKQWDKTFGGNHDDDLQAMVATPDGGFLLGGSSNSGVTGDKTAANINPCLYSPYCDTDFWIIKIDSVGRKQWDQVYGDSARYDSGYRLDVYEDLTSLIATPDGGFLLGGISNFKLFDMWVVKINSTGDKQWSYHYNRWEEGGHHESLSKMVSTEDGGYLLGGSVHNFGQSDIDAGRGYQDFWLVKIDHQGKYLWNKTFGGNDNDELVSLVSTPDGGYLLGGNSYSDKSGDKTDSVRGDCNVFNYCPTDYWVVKTDRDGNKLWDKTLGGPSDDALIDLEVSKDGNYLICGSSISGIGFDKTQSLSDDPDFWLVMLDQEGRKLWDKTLGGSGSDYLSSVITAAQGGYLLAGISDSDKGRDKGENTRGGYDYWLVKMLDPDSTGCTASGSILREYWRNIRGIRVRDILQDSPPTSTSLLTHFEGPANIGEEYASRIRGYICAPQTGTYTFWIAGDNETQLWLSTDDKPANKIMIANHPTWTQPRSWYERPSQQSAPILLVAGKRYYIEALHKEGTREDHVAVAWRLPDGKMEAPIPGSRLAPYETDSAPASLANEKRATLPTPLELTGIHLRVFPNPFSSTTTLAFTSPEDAEAVLEILSLQGVVVETLFRGVVQAKAPAQYKLRGSELANGVYLARLRLNGKSSYQRLVVNK